MVVACGDSGGTGASGGGNPGGSPAQGGGGNGGEAPNGGAGGAVSDGGGGGCPEGGAPEGMGGAIEACSDIGAADCFTNYDCADDQRCENQGTADFAVPCCVTGDRGTAGVGAPCLGENDCASSLCVEGGVCGGICSDRCDSPDECPAELSQCIPIAFSGSDDKFCLPR